jgi:four helix bundle protein
MTLKFGELKILKAAEEVADEIWKEVIQWDPFVRDTIGKQITTSADPIGANIAEAFGRFYYGEKVRFLYYARGSLFETKYWLNRTNERDLIGENQANEFTQRLSNLARQLNAFISNMKAQKLNDKSKQKSISDNEDLYLTNLVEELPTPLFGEEELQWIEST